MVQRITSTQGWDVPMTGIVPRFTATPGAIRHPGARLGEHTDEVLTDLLGLAPDQLADLHAAGIIAGNPS
jgi:formyl-CoA transferase